MPPPVGKRMLHIFCATASRLNDFSCSAAPRIRHAVDTLCTRPGNERPAACATTPAKGESHQIVQGAAGQISASPPTSVMLARGVTGMTFTGNRSLVMAVERNRSTRGTVEDLFLEPSPPNMCAGVVRSRPVRWPWIQYRQSCTLTAGPMSFGFPSRPGHRAIPVAKYCRSGF